MKVVDGEDRGFVTTIEPEKALEVALYGLPLHQTFFDQPFSCLEQLVEVLEYSFAAQSGRARSLAQALMSKSLECE